MSSSSLPAIGVFDSGIGGITVLSVLAKKFPHERFIYLGDTARLPYGSKSPKTIERYTAQNLSFLKMQGVKALIIACNSASAQWSGTDFDDIPVFNVITPGARAAIKATHSKRIGIIGTRATIASKAYNKALQQIDNELQIFTQACPLLVPLCEEGWVDDPVTNLIVYRYLQPLLQQNIDTLILGCTHYPILHTAISRVMGKNIQLIDSGQSVSEDLEAAIVAGKIKASPFSQDLEISIFCTDTGPSFRNFTGDLLRQHNLNFDQFEMADLSEVR